MSYKKFYSDLQKSNLKSLYIFSGNELYMKKLMIKKCMEKFISSDIDFFETMDKNPDFNDIISASSMIPFMSLKKLIVVHNGSFIFTSKVSEIDLDKFLNIHKDNSSIVTILLVNDLDKRKKSYKKIAKVAELFEFNKLEEKSFTDFVIKTLEKNSTKITSDALRYYVKNSNYLEKDSLETLYSVEKKLEVIAAASNGIIDKKTIVYYVNANSENNVFKWRNAVLVGDIKNALLYLNTLSESGKKEIYLVFMLNQLILELLNISLLMDAGKSDNEIIKIRGLQSFVFKNNCNILNKISRENLIKIYNLSLDADNQMKYGGIDSDVSLKKLIYDIAILLN